MYNDEEIESIEYFLKRAYDLVQVYKFNKSEEVLFLIINETILTINNFVHK